MWSPLPLLRRLRGMLNVTPQPSSDWQAMKEFWDRREVVLAHHARMLSDAQKPRAGSCTGSMAIGTGCGKCARCINEVHVLDMPYKGTKLAD